MPDNGIERIALLRPLVRYGFAVLSAIIAQVCRIPLHPQSAIPFITYIPFIVFASWFCGFGPGLVATGICTLECLHFVTGATRGIAVIGWQDWVGITILWFTGLVSSGLFESLRKVNSSHMRPWEKVRGLPSYFAAIAQSADDPQRLQENKDNYLYLLNKAFGVSKRSAAFGPTRSLVALITVVLLINGVFAYESVLKLVANDRWVTHSYEVLSGLEQIVPLLEGAEKDNREYIFTGKRENLLQVNAAGQEVFKRIGELKRLTSDNPRQQARFPELEPQISSELSLLQREAEIRHGGSFGGEQIAVLQNEGKHRIDEVQAIVSGMASEENRLLDERRGESTRNSRQVESSFVFATALAVSFLLLVARILEREQRLRSISAEAADRYRGISDYAAVGITQVALDGRLISVNPALCRMLGYAEDELVGKKSDDLAHPDDRENDRRQVDLLLRGQQEFVKMELRYLRRDGQPLWVVLSSSTVKNLSGDPLSRVTVIQDIDALKRTDQSLAEKARLLDLSYDATLVLDADHHITYWNQGAFNAYGYKDDEAVGCDPHKLLQTKFPKPLDEITSILERDGRWSGELVHRRKDGTEITVSSRWVLDKGKDEKGVRLLETNSDITDRKKAEEDLRRSEEQLRALASNLEKRVQERTAELISANKELESFAYSVSHDLRAPLRGIDGWSCALVEDFGDKLEVQARQYLDRVRSEAQRMGHLIDELLRLSRVNRAELSRSKINLSSLADRISCRIREANPARDTEFVIAPGLSATADLQLMDIALTNLLDNAAKFSSKRAKAKVEFGITNQPLHDQHAPQFYVRDNGAGFDMAYASQLFGPFQRLHSASEFPGTGIGLATVQRIISRHGGTIFAESKPEQGATFYFTLGGLD